MDYFDFSLPTSPFEIRNSRKRTQKSMATPQFKTIYLRFLSSFAAILSSIMATDCTARPKVRQI
jgi:hypothetical protein